MKGNVLLFGELLCLLAFWFGLECLHVFFFVFFLRRVESLVGFKSKSPFNPKGMLEVFVSPFTMRFSPFGLKARSRMSKHATL